MSLFYFMDMFIEALGTVDFDPAADTGREGSGNGMLSGRERQDIIRSGIID